MKVYSMDDEDYSYQDIGSLFDGMASEGNLVVGQEYYEADAEHITHEMYIDGYGILEQIDERVYDDIGECYNNDFGSVSKEAKQELETLLVEWAKKYVDLNYWRIKQCRKKLITEEDIM